MAIAPADSGFTEITVSSASWSLPAPAGLAAGDLLHITVTTSVASMTMSSKPAEATLLTSGSGGSMTAFAYLYVCPSTPPASLPFTLSAATVGSIAWDRYTGVDTTTPLDAPIARTPASGTTSATSWAPGAVTAATDGAMVVAGLCVPSGSRTVTPPGGWTTRVAATGRLGYLAMKGIQATAGSTGAASSFGISSTALNGFAYQLALRPATGSGAQTATPSGIGSALAVGAIAAALALTVTPTGIDTAAAVGVPAMSGALAVTPDGVAGAATPGVPAATTTLTVAPAGINTTAAAGTPVASLVGSVTPAGIATGAAPGTPSALTSLTVSPAGIPSSAATGPVSIAYTVTVAPTGISTLAQTGAVAATTTLTVVPSAIAPEGLPGTPAAIDPGTLHDITVTASIDPRRWTATLEPRAKTGELGPRDTAGTLDDRRWTATLDPRRWKGTL